MCNFLYYKRRISLSSALYFGKTNYFQRFRFIHFMFTLARYILRLHIGPFFFGLSVITLIFLLNLMFREIGRILSKGLEFTIVVEFFVLNMAWIIALAVPMAVLMASLMAFGRLSADNEITAMKACGINIYHIIAPVVLTSIVLALFLIWFNNSVLPEFNHRLRLLYGDISRKRPTIALEPGVYFDEIRGYGILVNELQEKGEVSYVKGVFVEDNSTEGVNKIITAQHGEITIKRHSGTLVLTLFDGELHQLDLNQMQHYRRVKFPKHRLAIEVPGLELTRSQSEYRGDREKSAQMMRNDVAKNDQSIAERRREIAKVLDNFFIQYLPKTMWPDTILSKPALQMPDKSDTGFYASAEGSAPNLSILHSAIQRRWQANLPGQSTGASPASAEMIKNELAQIVSQINRETEVIKAFNRSNYVLKVEIHKKYSIPFACLVFVLIGAPLGIMARSGGLAVGGGLSIGFFLLYYASLIGGEELADRQYITPFLAMWLANIVVGMGGIYLVIRSVYETTIIRWQALGQQLVNWLKSFRTKPARTNEG